MSADLDAGTHSAWLDLAAVSIALGALVLACTPPRPADGLGIYEPWRLQLRDTVGANPTDDSPLPSPSHSPSPPAAPEIADGPRFVWLGGHVPLMDRETFARWAGSPMVQCELAIRSPAYQKQVENWLAGGPRPRSQWL